MRILLLGCTGQVGWELQRSLAPLGEVVSCDFTESGDRHAEFSQPDSLVALFERFAPTAVVNAAAHTAVDKAESEPALAQALNADAPGVLARAAAQRGIPMVHYSTDYVFDGSGNHPRTEDDQVAPMSVYGRTKAHGEQQVRQAGGAHLILRTSWVYAARGGNFAKSMLRLAAERELLKVVNDQIGAPTGADLLADVTAHALQRLRLSPEVSGTYHCVAAGETSWFGYARHVIDRAREAGKPLKRPADGLKPITTQEYPVPAARPLNSRLDTRKLRDTFGLRLPPWEAGVDRMLTEIL
jgi:dTDP-4-dehydrorhamnose reductase